MTTKKAAKGKPTGAKKGTTKRTTKKSTKSETPVKEVTGAPVVVEPVEETPVETTGPDKSKGRNTEKYTFEGKTLGKGRLVLAVVAAHVKANPKITYAKLLEAFPHNLLKRFGIFREVEEARAMSSRPRFFFNDADLIRLADKRVIAICSQFTSENLVPFLAQAKKLGYKIK